MSGGQKVSSKKRGKGSWQDPKGVKSSMDGDFKGEAAIAEKGVVRSGKRVP